VNVSVTVGTRRETRPMKRSALFAIVGVALLFCSCQTAQTTKRENTIPKTTGANMQLWEALRDFTARLQPPADAEQRKIVEDFKAWFSKISAVEIQYVRNHLMLDGDESSAMFFQSMNSAVRENKEKPAKPLPVVDDIRAKAIQHLGQALLIRAQQIPGSLQGTKFDNSTDLVMQAQIREKFKRKERAMMFEIWVGAVKCHTCFTEGNTLGAIDHLTKTVANVDVINNL